MKLLALLIFLLSCSISFASQMIPPPYVEESQQDAAPIETETESEDQVEECLIDEYIN